MNYSRKALTVFKIYDKNTDGFLEFNEVFRFLKDLCKTDGKDDDIFIHDVEYLWQW